MAEKFDIDAVKSVLAEAAIKASEAASEHLSQYGDADACGFAWATVWRVRANSKMGKVLVAEGFRKSCTGGLELWNPSRNSTQCITAKEKGALAYAKVLREKLSVDASAGSRMD